MNHFIRFALIGVINTGIHFLFFIGLVELMGLWPPMANALAFLGANIFSYMANSHFNFKTRLSLRRYLKFFVTSLIGMAVSYGLSLLVEQVHGHYVFGFVLLILVMPLINYFLVRRLVFADVGRMLPVDSVK